MRRAGRLVIPIALLMAACSQAAPSAPETGRLQRDLAAAVEARATLESQVRSLEQQVREGQVQALEEQVQRRQGPDLPDAGEPATAAQGGMAAEGGRGAAQRPRASPADVPVPFAIVPVSDLPAPVRQWAERFRNTVLAGTRTFGDHTYLAAAHAGHWVAIREVVRRGDSLEVTVYVGHGAGEPLAVARIPRFAGDVTFHTVGDDLPQVRNAHGLPEVPLPAEGDAVVLAPQSGAVVQSPLTVEGYARHLFEGHIAVTVRTAGGQLLARQAGTAAACCYDWGSFRLTVPFVAPPGAELVVEVGTAGGREDSYRVLARMPVRAGKK